MQIFKFLTHRNRVRLGNSVFETNFFPGFLFGSDYSFNFNFNYLLFGSFSSSHFFIHSKTKNTTTKTQLVVVLILKKTNPKQKTICRNCPHLSCNFVSVTELKHWVAGLELRVRCVFPADFSFLFLVSAMAFICRWSVWKWVAMSEWMSQLL